MNTDRELLELAAKAAGFEGRLNFTHRCAWNPLINAFDALDLACTLYMTVKIDYGMYTLVDAEMWQRGIFIDAVVELHKDTTPLQATCRAIVRAAAEIGKAMS